MCKDNGISSPRVQQKIYHMARDEAVTALRERGVVDPDEEVDRFNDNFMDFLETIITIQPKSTTSTPLPVVHKSPFRDPIHQMPKVDVKIPATSGVGIVVKSQEVIHANIHK